MRRAFSPVSYWVILARPALLASAAVGLACFSVAAQDDSAVPPAPVGNSSGADPAGVNTAPPASAPDADTGTGPTDDGATFQTFYDSLSNQGTWIQSSDYGYVWQPTVTDPDWAPYTDGHWAYTEDGWTWVSDESYGWAVYHYGRWVNLDGTGWVWVPGYTWAPAWVSWRYGDGYAGWAPLPPDSFMGIDYFGTGDDASGGYHIGGDVDDFYGIGAGWYIFLPVECLGYRHYHGHYCDRHDNYDRINHTHNVTNINVTHRGGGFAGAGGRTVTTGGPQLAAVNSVSATPIERQRLVHTSQAGVAASAPGTLAVYAPRIRGGASGAPSRLTGAIGPAHVNRGTDIAAPLAVNAHLAPAAASPAQISSAHTAAAQAPSSAKVVTGDSAVHSTLQAPLTSFRPVTSMPFGKPSAGTAGANESRPTQSAGLTERAPVAGGYGATVEPHSTEPREEIYHAPTAGIYPGAPPSTSRSEAPEESTSREESPGNIYPGRSSAPYYQPPGGTAAMPGGQRGFETEPGGVPPAYARPVTSPAAPRESPQNSPAAAVHESPSASSGSGAHAPSSGSGSSGTTGSVRSH
jgi:hypothetical protein